MQVILKKSLPVRLVWALSVWLPLSAFAESSTTATPDRKLPKSGLLATSSISGAGSTIIGDTFGGEELFARDLPPITGSISRKDDATWSFSVSNNSEDRYSINVDLIQKSETGSTVKFGSYSYSLRPGQSERQTVQAGSNVSRAELHLRSYRNLTAQRKNTTESE
jgi:hypothetical protein